jgi:DNA polymerase-3 subunit gamma/tau
MSYQVLARKWRPKTFREMVGQEHVLKALINALDHNRLHHAYLFTGTRGVGKTTIARILAKCLNCDVGVSSEPCGQCSACQSINDGRFVDLIEVDAASRTKVEDTRELLENVQYAPTTGRFKVYLIDEVHMLSNHSFNALLKTLEEPPPHVKFLLATTDPQKLPATILSRCLQFNLKNITPERIVSHLQYVLGQEMIAFEEPPLWLLGRAADGSMRDALSLTDQAVSFGAGKLLEADVRNMLGTIDQSSIYTILQALQTADGAKVLAAVQHLSEHAPDYSSALEELLTQLHRIAICQAVPDAVDNSFGDGQQLAELSSQLTAEDVQLFYQLGLTGRRDLPLAPDPRSGFEMVLLRMLAFKPAGIPQLPQAGLRNSASPAASATAPVVAPPPAAAAPPPAEAQSSPQPVPAAVSPVPAAVNQEAPQPVKKSETSGTQSSHSDEATGRGPSTAPAADELADKSPQPAADSPPFSAPYSSREQPTLVPAAAVSNTAEAAAVAVEAQTGGAEVAANVVDIATPAQVSNISDSAITSAEPLEIDIAALSPSELTAEIWSSHFEQLGFGGVVGNIASHCVLQRIDGDRLFLLLDEANATLFNEAYTARIETHLSVTLNAPLSVTISVGAMTEETPAARKQRLIKARREQAVLSLQNDPNVQTLINEFDATLELDSVQPQ